jgi:ATP-binding cassette subfamily B protein
MLRHLRRHAWSYAAGVLCLVVTNVLNMGVPWLLKVAFDGLQRGAEATLHARVALALVALALGRAVVRTVSRLYILGTSRRAVTEIREEVFAHLQRLPVGFFDRTPTGDIVSRLTADLQHVRSLYGPVAMNLANTVILYVVTLATLLRLDATLTLVALVPYVGVAALMKHYGARMHLESTRVQEALARISSHLSENLSGITVVKSFRREREEIRRFDALTDAHYESGRRFSRTRALVVPLIGAVGGLGTLAVLWLGGLRAMAGTFSLGDFVAFTTCLAMLSWPSMALGWVVNSAQRAAAAMDRIEGLCAEPPEEAVRVAAAGAGWAPGDIEVRDLTFTHDGAGRPSLREVSFRVRAGGRLGIVGRTGGGKSTLVEILTGVRRPPPGAVRIGGRDVNDVPRAELRRAVGCVPQGAFVFSTSIRENVSYALDDPAPADVVAAAVEDAALDKDLAQLPHGLDTVVGERGVTLSGGQRQRVTIARALAKDPDILVLDDALSAVDAGTEREILERLDARRRRRSATEVLVSHRLSAVETCDEILVLDDGAVVERGTHEALLRLGGTYARTWREQELERELEEAS